MNIDRKSLLLMSAVVGLTASLCTTLLLLGFQAAADSDPSTDTVPRLIPYNGTLELNGEPVTATGDDGPRLKFDLIDASGRETVVYTETIQVSVYNGKFTAMLGPMDDDGTTSIQDVVASADNLLLQLTILGEDGGGDVVLSNRQQLVISPFAMWATNATNFEIANVLTVANGTVFSGPEVDGSVNSGALEITRDLEDYLENGDSPTMFIDDNSIDTKDQELGLQVNSGLKTRIGGEIEIDGDTLINGELRNTGALNFSGDVRTDGDIITTGGSLLVDDDIIADGDIVTDNEIIVSSSGVGNVDDPSSLDYNEATHIVIGEREGDMSIYVNAFNGSGDAQASSRLEIQANSSGNNNNVTFIGGHVHIDGSLKVGGTCLAGSCP